MNPDRLSHVAPLVKLGAVDTGELQVGAEPLGPSIHVHGVAMVIDEHARLRRRVASQRAPRFQRPHHVSPEGPRAWIVCLVGVEAHGAALEVHVAEREPRGLARPHPLAREEPVEEPEA